MFIVRSVIFVITSHFRRAEHDAAAARAVKRGTCVSVNGAEVLGTLADSPPAVKMDNLELKEEQVVKLRETLVSCSLCESRIIS